jgi:HSP20 family protein
MKQILMLNNFNNKAMNILRFTNPLGYNALSDSSLNHLLCDMKNETYFGIPKANVVEGKDNFRLELSVPGFTKEQISIQFQDHLLIVKGSVDEKQNEDEKFLSREFGLKSFIRRFSIPKTVEADHINASFSNGILTILVPKMEEVKEKEAKDILID